MEINLRRRRRPAQYFILLCEHDIILLDLSNTRLHYFILYY